MPIFVILVLTISVVFAQEQELGMLPENIVIPENADTSLPLLIVPSFDSSLVRVNDSLLLSLEQCMDLLIRYSNEIHDSKYQWLSRKENAMSNWGEFEPRLVGKYNKEQSARPGALVNELKEEYKLGIEGSLPTGAQYNVGFTQTSYQHSAYNSEIYFGGTIKQPVMRGIFFGSPIANLRMSKLESKRLFHEYRSTLTDVIEKLCTTYWDYYYALQVLGFESQSVDVAKSILEDAGKRLTQGKISALDLNKAKSELAIRISRRLDALSNARDARSQLVLLLSDPGLTRNQKITVRPSLSIDSMPILDSIILLDSIRRVHPEYLAQQNEIERRKISRDYHKDQLLPSVNLMGSFGIKAVDRSADAARIQFKDDNLRKRVGSAGVEMEFPIFLNYKERHLVQAEEHSVRAAQMRLALIENKLSEDNQGLALHVRELMEQTGYEHTAVEYQREELSEEFKKLQAGKSNYHTIYDMEEKMREAQKKEIEVIRMVHIIEIKRNRAMGSLLLKYGLESVGKDGIVLRWDLVE
jgi:outer membrane protein TolC